MHTLTKVFIVLWALASVFVMALAIPLVTNNDTWKARYEAEKAQRLAAEGAADILRNGNDLAAAAHAQAQSELQSRITALETEIAGFTTELASLRSQLATARQDKEAIEANLNQLVAAAETNASIIQNQNGEITQRREESLALTQRAIELEDQLRDTLSKLDVALDAQRILQEQYAALQEASRGMVPADASAQGAVDADDSVVTGSPRVAGRVLSVSTGEDGRRYAEINLGSRDGVQENMKFFVHDGGNFLANLIITEVDLNRSVGRIDLEQNQVAVNDQVRGTGGNR